MFLPLIDWPAKIERGRRRRSRRVVRRCKGKMQDARREWGRDKETCRSRQAVWYGIIVGSTRTTVELINNAKPMHTHSLTRSHAFIHLFIHSFGQSVGQPMRRHNHRPDALAQESQLCCLLLLSLVVVIVVDRQDTFPDVVIIQACELLRSQRV